MRAAEMIATMQSERRPTIYNDERHRTRAWNRNNLEDIARGMLDGMVYATLYCHVSMATRARACWSVICAFPSKIKART